ncbi:MAG TPA: hypothetical protein P5150_07850 [Candidatus Ratteibacteria bacterium]|nr:hypothetical protein [Candidatus Ratteibacteria bacterium]
MKKIFILLLIGIFLTGCATKIARYRTECEKNLLGKEGVITFEQVVGIYGLPHQTLEEGDTIIAGWVLDAPATIYYNRYKGDSSFNASSISGYGSSSILGHGSSSTSGYEIPIQKKGIYLIMTFDKQTNLLKSWKVIER